MKMNSRRKDLTQKDCKSRNSKMQISLTSIVTIRASSPPRLSKLLNSSMALSTLIEKKVFSEYGRTPP